MRVFYRLSLSRSAQKQLMALPDNIVEKISAKIDLLESHPFPAGCKKLTGSDDTWRIRIGDYRVIYSVNQKDKSIDVSAVRHRKDAHR